MNKIKHDGIITKIEDNKITVSIQSLSACGGCTAKSMCNLSESKTKEVEVVSSKKYNLGDEVTITMNYGSGLDAVFWAYCMPFIVLMASLIILVSTTHNELLSAVCALVAVAIYYLTLKLFEKRIARRYKFQIE
jgi:sigma-E factor negative regulatory protein RseC